MNNLKKYVYAFLCGSLAVSAPFCENGHSAAAPQPLGVAGGPADGPIAPPWLKRVAGKEVIVCAYPDRFFVGISQNGNRMVQFDLLTDGWDVSMNDIVSRVRKFFEGMGNVPHNDVAFRKFANKVCSHFRGFRCSALEYTNNVGNWREFDDDCNIVDIG
jgi:hypothetical protein